MTRSFVAILIPGAFNSNITVSSSSSGTGVNQKWCKMNVGFFDLSLGNATTGGPLVITQQIPSATNANTMTTSNTNTNTNTTTNTITNTITNTTSTSAETMSSSDEGSSFSTRYATATSGPSDTVNLASIWRLLITCALFQSLGVQCD